jgi:hypothetical protein
MRWRVQFGINSTSDVWKFCQNLIYLLNSTSTQPSPRLSLSRACYAWFIGVRRGTCGGRGVAVGKGRRGRVLQHLAR